MNTITIELCAEDRARLDKLQVTMEKLADLHPNITVDNIRHIPEELLRGPIGVQGPDGDPGDTAPAEEQLPEQQTIPEVVEPEKAPEPEAAPEPQPEVVKVERSDIQKKVVALSGAGKKDEVRSIVLAYGNTKVSNIPEDKLPEVMAKLTALEG